MPAKQRDAILWKHDRDLSHSSAGIIGVDEAGRGCLAGPVFAAAVYLPADFFERPWKSRTPPRIDDSKKLKITERENAYRFVNTLREDKQIYAALGTADVGEIEQHNILGATTLAMRRALEGLRLSNPPTGEEALPLWQTSNVARKFPKILVDGRPVKTLGFAHQSLIQGDGKSLAIALASILAKVERDYWMAKAHDNYPGFGWNTNRGYGTHTHVEAIRARGPCPLHRKTFLRKIFPSENA